MRRRISISCKQQFLINVIFVLIYRFILEISFLKIVIPYFTYPGMTFHWIPAHALISVILTFCTAVVLNRLYQSKYVSDLAMVVFLVFNFIPGTVYYSYSEMSFFWLFVLFYFTLISINRIIPHFSLQLPKKLIHRGWSNLFLIGCVIVIVYIWGRYAHFRIYFNIFSGIYSLRAEASQYQISTLLRYAFKMVQSILPVLAIYFIEDNRKRLAIVAMLVELLVFCINGSRSSIFLVLIPVCVYVGYKLVGPISKWVVICMGAVNLAACMELALTGTYKIGNMIVNRLLFMPNLLNYFYYEFAETHGLDFFQSGFLSHLGFAPRYGASLPKTIGMLYYGYYYGDQITNANNGLFSDAYVNLGFSGMIIMPVITVLFLRVYDACIAKMNRSMQAACAVVITAQLISDSIFTIILSGGAFIVMVLFCLLPKARNKEMKKVKFQF